MAPLVYLISGANRGIGLELVKSLLARENAVVFAGARDPSKALDLQSLLKDNANKLHVVQLISADQANNKAVAEQIKASVGRLDVVIANAGISKYFEPGLSVALSGIREHFEVNAIGVLALFQATYPLLRASTSTPKFVPISSPAGSITVGTTFPIPNIAYGISKAALNYLTKKLRAENDGLVCFPLAPGLVETDMVTQAREGMPMLKDIKIESLTPAEAAPMLLERIDEATRETDELVSYDKATLPW